MGNENFTLTDVPEDRVDFEMDVLRADYHVVTKEPQGHKLWTLRASQPRPDQPQGTVAAGAGTASTGGKPAALGAMDDVEILARTLWGEERSGSDAGLEAVAAVVMNRLAAPGHRFGHTVKDVCLEPKQFSCWNEGDPNRAKILALQDDDPVLARCRAIARRAVAGTVQDATNGALHYHAQSAKPVWAVGKQASAQIGGHLFYNNVA